MRLTSMALCSAVTVAEQLPLHCSTKLCNAPRPSAGTVTEEVSFRKPGNAAYTWYWPGARGLQYSSLPHAFPCSTAAWLHACSMCLCLHTQASPVIVSEPTGMGAPVNAIHSDDGRHRRVLEVQAFAMLQGWEVTYH